MYMIASWGSSGAGKTTVALALAAAFAQMKRDVLVISSETRTPALPVMLPMPQAKKLDSRNSIGPLLAMSSVTEASLKDRINPHPKSRHIFVMGLASGEATAITYSTPTRAAALNLFQLLMQTPFAYVIVDCDSSPLYDQMTLAALEYAQSGLMILTPDAKGFEFQKAQLSWLSNSDVFHLEHFSKVASPVFPFSPMSEARALFSGFSSELPYSPEVAERMMAAELLTGLSSGSGVLFERRIKQLAKTLEQEAIKNAR